VIGGEITGWRALSAASLRPETIAVEVREPVELDGDLTGEEPHVKVRPESGRIPVPATHPSVGGVLEL